MMDEWLKRGGKKDLVALAELRLALLGPVGVRQSEWAARKVHQAVEQASLVPRQPGPTG